jgi:hypothetical protein
VNETAIWIGSTMCRLLSPIGLIDVSAKACGEPSSMAVFGGTVILMAGIATAMLSVMGRNIRPRHL